MAVDSAAKRFSILGLGNPTVFLRVPAGSIAAAQRATLVHLYEGIALGEPAAPVSARRLIIRFSARDSDIIFKPEDRDISVLPRDKDLIIRN